MPQPGLQQSAKLWVGNAQQRGQWRQACGRRSCRSGYRQLVKRQTCGWRISRKGARPIQATHFKTGHALVEHRFDRSLPTRFDLQFLPESTERGELVLRKPRLKRPLLLNVFL